MEAIRYADAEDTEGFTFAFYITFHDLVPRGGEVDALLILTFLL